MLSLSTPVATTTLAADQDCGLYTEELYSELLLAQLALDTLSGCAAVIGQTKPIVCQPSNEDVDLRQQEMEPQPSPSACAIPEPESVGTSGCKGDPGAPPRLTEEGVPNGSIVPDEMGNGANGRDSTVISVDFGTTTSKRRTMLYRRRSPRLECTCCFEKRRCIAAPCSHVYCRECITSLVEVCIRDESLYPIKCCKQPLSKAQLSRALNAKLRVDFELKCHEFNTSPDLRIYCSNQKCSKFLGSSTNSVDKVLCSACHTSTCVRCKQGSHPNDTCRGNAETLKIHELAKHQKWQTCPGCKAIVELVEGCFHMTCRCRTEFCYVCGDKWKRCRCHQLREDLPVILQPRCGGRNEPRSLRAILMRWIRRLRR